MFHFKVLKPLHAGDRVVFTASRRGTHPGARAKDIQPERHGEGYFYFVDKYWIVTETHETKVVLMTRRGKIHVVEADDPHLHRASWLQKIIYRERFPRMPEAGTHTSQPA